MTISSEMSYFAPSIVVISFPDGFVKLNFIKLVVIQSRTLRKSCSKELMLTGTGLGDWEYQTIILHIDDTGILVAIIQKTSDNFDSILGNLANLYRKAPLTNILRARWKKC